MSVVATSHSKAIRLSLQRGDIVSEFQPEKKTRSTKAERDQQAGKRWVHSNATRTGTIHEKRSRLGATPPKPTRSPRRVEACLLSSTGERLDAKRTGLAPESTVSIFPYRRTDSARIQVIGKS